MADELHRASLELVKVVVAVLREELAIVGQQARIARSIGQRGDLDPVIVDRGWARADLKRPGARRLLIAGSHSHVSQRPISIRDEGRSLQRVDLTALRLAFEQAAIIPQRNNGRAKLLHPVLGVGQNLMLRAGLAGREVEDEKCAASGGCVGVHLKDEAIMSVNTINTNTTHYFKC